MFLLTRLRTSSILAAIFFQSVQTGWTQKGFWVVIRNDSNHHGCCWDWDNIYFILEPSKAS